MKEIRYPEGYIEPSIDEARELYETAKEVTKFIIKRLKEKGLLRQMAKLYWKKQLGEKLAVKEEKVPERLENECMKIIEGVYKTLIKDNEIPEHIERIKEHAWVKVVEENL